MFCENVLLPTLLRMEVSATVFIIGKALPSGSLTISLSNVLSLSDSNLPISRCVLMENLFDFVTKFNKFPCVECTCVLVCGCFL